MLFNEVIYNFKIKKTLTLLHNLNKFVTKNLTQRRLKYRVEVIKAIVFINVKIKMYYDLRYVSLIMRLNKKTYLKLNYDY